MFEEIDFDNLRDDEIRLWIEWFLKIFSTYLSPVKILDDIVSRPPLFSAEALSIAKNATDTTR